MSTVDVIYGVTMQEPGVSKLVPVDFRNLAASN
jgi:chromosome segregation protein